MEKILEECSICLTKPPNLLNIVSNETSNGSCLFKLQLCVPEIEWKETFMICMSCTSDLDLVYEFRERCLNSDNIRKIGPPTVDPEDSETKILLPQITDIKIEPQENAVVTFKCETPPTTAEQALRPKFRFACEHCDLSFKTSTKAVVHTVECHNVEAKDVKPFVCHICNNRYSNSDKLQSHLIYHKDDRNHICTFCGKGFKMKSDVRVHEKIHLNKREYKCETCDKSYNTHKDLRSHKFVVHTDPSQWPHCCAICTKRFPMKSNYDTHMRRHRNERPFGCNICEKKFIEKIVLQKHLLSHSNKREFSCHVCKKEYKDKSFRDIHMKKHHGLGNAKIPEKIGETCADSYRRKTVCLWFVCEGFCG